MGLGLLIALVVGSILGSGIFDLPQNMASGAGTEAIVIGRASSGLGKLLLAFVYQMRSRKPAPNNGVFARVEVDTQYPSFAHPLKPLGPVYTQEEGHVLTLQHHWTMAADGPTMRRVVAYPKPVQVLGLQTIVHLLDRCTLVIEASDRGIPMVRGADGHYLESVEAVIDKYLCMRCWQPACRWIAWLLPPMSMRSTWTGVSRVNAHCTKPLRRNYCATLLPTAPWHPRCRPRASSFKPYAGASS